MTAEKFLADLEEMWEKSRKETRFQMQIGPFIYYYNPYDEKEYAEAVRLMSIYVDELKNGREAAQQKVLAEYQKTKTP